MAGDHGDPTSSTGPGPWPLGRSGAPGVEVVVPRRPSALLDRAATEGIHEMTPVV